MKENIEIFEEFHKDASSNARVGVLNLPHGRVRTPSFMPVGTLATVKAMTKDMLEELGFDIILANTYHLNLRPGIEVIKNAGGLHGFTGWQRNFLTDSGGFQVFSLSRLRKITEEGIKFQSHIDGSCHLFTPENVVNLQTGFNSDIQMQLDVLSPYGSSKKETQEHLDITINYMKRAFAAWLGTDSSYNGSLFPIMQGGFYKDLREQSLQAILEHSPRGIAIGGLSVGEPEDVYNEFLSFSTSIIPREKPVYVMGIGTPEYILEAVKNGVDLFDCVLPSRNARNGNLFTFDGPISIKQKRYELDNDPIDLRCNCAVCRRYSKAYLRHLFKSKEILYSTLATYHNLAFLSNLMFKIRDAIKKDKFMHFYNTFLKIYNGNKVAED